MGMYDAVSIHKDFFKRSREDWSKIDGEYEYVGFQTKDDKFNLILDDYYILTDGTTVVFPNDLTKKPRIEKPIKWTRIFEIHKYFLDEDKYASYTLAIFKGNAVLLLKNSPKQNQIVFLSEFSCFQCRVHGSLLKYNKRIFCVNCGTKHTILGRNFSFTFSEASVEHNQKDLSKLNNDSQMVVNLVGEIK